jgi:SAM-dependent methyltransferase
VRNTKCVEFVETSLARADIEGKDVLDAGPFDLSESTQEVIEGLKPNSYRRLNDSEGHGLDPARTTGRLIDEFGTGAYDVVLLTQTVEHMGDWRSAIHNVKHVVKGGGVIVMTARSPGFPVHASLPDFWRFTAEDMRVIFSDCALELAASDTGRHPGVFVKVRAPQELVELDLGGYALHSMITGRRELSVEDAERLIALEESVARTHEITSASRSESERAVEHAALVQGELDRIYASRTLRYSAPLRRAYGHLRRRAAAYLRTH